MDTFSSFFAQHIVIVYFFYGLAFFSMGLAVWLESGRSSEFRLARAMGPLAAFGILHAMHEWMEMFQRLETLVPDAPVIARTVAVDAFRVGLLAFSFLMLIVFGVRLIHSSGKGRGTERTFVLLSAGVLLLVWVTSVVATQRVYDLCLEDCLISIDVLTRYILAMPGAALAAWAMLLEQRAFRERGMENYGRDLQWAAIALVTYGVVGQAFVPRSVLFPSTVINGEWFFDTFGFPIQLFRALAATAVAIFMIRALRAFEWEHRQRLQTANEARLSAQEQALAAQRRARRDTEALNRELQIVVQDLSLLFELSRSLATTLDRNALLERALHQILRSMPRIQAGMILWREQADRPLRIMVSSGCDAGTTGDANALVCERVRRVGEQVVLNEAPTLCCNGDMITLEHSVATTVDRAEGHFQLHAEGRILGVPLVVDEAIHGSLVLGVNQQTSPFTTRDLSLLSTVAGQLSMAMQNASLYAEVQEREELRSELYRRIVSAQERERKRIARELHDGTGQVLTGLGLGLKAVAETVQRDPALASAQLLELKDLNVQALQELRDLIRDLRPTILDDLGLVPALQAQVKEFEARTGVEAALVVSGRRQRLEPEVETVIFRIAQEALTNVAKHAEAENALVRLIFDVDSMQLIVTDNGRGFDPQAALQQEEEKQRAWGLLGMQERITLIGGVCEIASRPGRGTTVRIWIPLHKESEEVTHGEEDQINAG